MGSGRASGGSSSSDEDGDAEWRAAIDSITSTTITLPSSNGNANHCSHTDNQEQKSHKSGLKLCQIKAQKIFNDHLEKNLEIVRMPDPLVSDDAQSDGGIIRLFKRAPPGMSSQDTHHVQNKRPRILPGEETNEKSKMFKKQIKSIAVDGTHIIESAKKACAKSQARCDARETLKKEKARREEERILELKKLRGEMWLPSIARELKKEARRN